MFCRDDQEGVSEWWIFFSIFARSKITQNLKVKSQSEMNFASLAR